MKKQMKAILTEGYGKAKITEVPVPEAYGDRVLVKVCYCGICGTDQDLFSSDCSFVEDGLVTYGHVVDIEEMFDDDDQTGNEQLLIHVRLLVSNIIFIGNSSFLLLEITKD